MILNRKRDSIIKSITFILFGIILYNELISYLIQYYTWPEVICGENTKNHHKILIIADPQILGEQRERWIARWDSDRYLAKTFSLAVRHVKPNYIIFLGDLMDEGSIATVDQYIRYYKRFKEIYMLDVFLKNTTIFVPGDNDIGGEDEEITSLKVTRYFKHFHQDEHIEGENIEFIKVNKLLKTYPIVKDDEKKVNVRVMISHMPILGSMSFFTNQVITTFKPDIIFSGHEHKSIHFVGDPNTGLRTFVEPLKFNQNVKKKKPIWRFELGNGVVNEITVPTCSYRMGVSEAGFGLALIDEDRRTICYSILWLPQRLAHLIAYLMSTPLLLALVLIIIFWRNPRFGRRSQPLL